MPRRIPPGPIIQRPIPGGGGEFNGIKNRFFSDGFRRLFGLAEGVAVESVAPEIMPTQDLDELRLLALGGAFPWQGVETALGPTAGNFSHIGFRNPTGSNLIAVIDYLVIRHTGGVGYSTGFRPLGTTTATQGIPFVDTRFTARRSPLLTWTLNDPAQQFSLGPIEALFHAASEEVYWPQNIVVSPGFDYFAVPAANNTAMIANFKGRAWRALPEELSLGVS